MCSLAQLAAMVLEEKDIGFGIVDSNKDAKVARKLGKVPLTIEMLTTICH